MINISAHIKNTCKRKMILPIIISLIMIILVFFIPFFKVFHPDNVKNIFNISSSDSYVSVTAKKLNYTGYNLIKLGNQKYGYYYAMENNKCIFVLIPINSNPEPELTNYTFKGKVMEGNSSFHKMLNKYVKDLNWDYDNIKDASADFVISSANYHSLFFIILFWVIILTLLISIRKIIEFLIAFLNPYRYPVCSFLPKKTGHKLIDGAQRQLDSENYLCINSMYITEDFFIDLGNGQASIIPLNQIVWCYRMGNVSVNPMKSASEFSLYFTIKNGRIIVVKHKTSDEALEAISAIHATEYKIIIGHSSAKKKRASKIVEKYKRR